MNRVLLTVVFTGALAGLSAGIAGLIAGAIGLAAAGLSVCAFAALVAIAATSFDGWEDDPHLADTLRSHLMRADASRPHGPEPVQIEALDPAEVLGSILRQASPAGVPLSSHLWILDSATSTMRLVQAVGPFPPGEEPVPVDDSIIGRAVTSGQAEFGARSRRTSGSVARTQWRYAVPLSAGDTVAAFALDIEADAPDREILARVLTASRPALAAVTAVVVARTEAESARALVRTAQDLVRLVDPEEVARTLLANAVAMAGAQTGSVMLLDSDGAMRIVASKGLPLNVTESTVVREGEGIAGWVLATGKSAVVEDLEGRGPRSRRHGVRSALSVPIADEDGMLGVLNVGSRDFQGRFSPAHQEALEAVGRLGALAIRNARAVDESQDLYFDTLKALAVALETKDPYSRGATDRVIDLSIRLGGAMGLSPAEMRALRIASLLHDVGMAAAGDLSAISGRPLSTVEWGLVKMHPVIAVDVLDQTPALREAIPIVYHHHENYDGSGYVTGLRGEAIPIGARVLSVADAFVAMTSERSYRGSLSASDALREMRERSGTQFDPSVVRALEEVLGLGTAADRQP